MMTSSSQPFSITLRLTLIVLAVLLLQCNVPTARNFCSAYSADCTFNQTPKKTDFWANLKSVYAGTCQHLEKLGNDFQTLALAHAESEKARSFKIVKVESKKSAGTNTFKWPVKGRISSGFGMRRHPVTYVRSFHNGIDIKARRGTNIVAPIDAVVVSAGRAGLLGRMVKLKTSNGLFLYFGHLQKISCKKGQKVSRGQIIGTVGSSGRATGPHLHFSVKVKSKYANPLTYLASH